MPLLSHINSRTTAPPADLSECERASSSVIVATFPRSGTHILIDLLLNNFSAYKRKPLYVELDHIITHLDRGHQAEHYLPKLLSCQGYLVKTHYPPHSREAPQLREEIAELFATSPIITVSRDREAIFRSEQTCGYIGSKEEHFSDIDRFEGYWNQYSNRLDLPFERLVNPKETNAVIRDLASFLGVESNTKLVETPPKSARYRVYTMKLLTRLFGKNAPRINTTIGFAK